MFHRGQRITIKKSSAYKRAHPNVGDVGYMGSAYLFYNDRFILMDAEFFSYPRHKSGERKSEKKRFIVDLGMSGALKSKIRTVGLKKKWFISSKYVVNLNPGYMDIDRYGVCGSPPISTLWPCACEMTAEKGALERKVKIPIGQIALLQSHRKYEVDKMHLNEMKAWIRIMSPLISISHQASKRANIIGDVYSKMHNLYGKLVPYIELKREYAASHIYLFGLSNMNGHNNQRIITRVIRYIQALAAVQQIGSEGYSVGSYITNEAKLSMRHNLLIDGANSLFNGGIKEHGFQDQWDLALSILFRASIMPGNTYNRLLLLKGILESADSEHAKKSIIIDKIKEEAKSDSAALARIFDSKLIS